jgi:glycosyltransferase involved in cell wall biosynthesis
VKVLFLGVACSEEVLRHATERHYGGRSEVRPQQRFDFALVSGLAESCVVEAVSEPPVSAFPRSSCLLYPPGRERISASLSIDYLPLLNLPLVKTLLISLQVLVRALAFGARDRGERKAILVGYISFSTALPALAAARVLGVPIFAVVPDLPRLVATYGAISNPLRRLGTRTVAALGRYVEPLFDGYVFLASAMNAAVNRRDRPHIVVEGMVDERGLPPDGAEPRERRPTVMYAGTIHRKFGVATLVEAFLRPELAGVDLWVLGNGDYLERLLEIAASAPNVVYKGVVGRDEILALERRVTLLVNPRPTADEFTRYSFPSKTLEYMASGTPLVSTRLAGIPADYEPHAYWFDDESAPGMARRIAEILAQPPAARDALGAGARAFVLGSKTASRQAARIAAFLRDQEGAAERRNR